MSDRQRGDVWSLMASAVAAVVAIAAVAMVASIAIRSGAAIEAITPLTLAMAIAAAVLAVAGAGGLVGSGHRDLGLLSATASVLMVSVVVLSIFGILVLPLVVVTVVVLVRRASGRRGVATALMSGPTIAVGLAVLLAIWVQPPLVECGEDGVTTTGRPWWGSSSGGGSSRSGSEVGGRPESAAVSTASMDTPSGRYEYRCSGGRLTDFRRVP